jgi:hypothetical protein
MSKPPTPLTIQKSGKKCIQLILRQLLIFKRATISLLPQGLHKAQWNYIPDFRRMLPQPTQTKGLLRTY